MGRIARIQSSVAGNRILVSHRSTSRGIYENRFCFCSRSLGKSVPWHPVAVTYNCLGADKVSGNSVVMELTFSDHGNKVGYTNQSITVIKKGWETLAQPIVFQMYGANKENNCKKMRTLKFFWRVILR